MKNHQTTAERRDLSPGSNVVYLNKVFFDDTKTSCPILFNLTTLPEAFTRQITFSPLQDRCGCEERDRERVGIRGLQPSRRNSNPLSQVMIFAIFYFLLYTESHVSFTMLLIKATDMQGTDPLCS